MSDDNNNQQQQDDEEKIVTSLDLNDTTKTVNNDDIVNTTTTEQEVKVNDDQEAAAKLQAEQEAEAAAKLQAEQEAEAAAKLQAEQEAEAAAKLQAEQTTTTTNDDDDNQTTTTQKSKRITAPKPKIILIAPPHTYISEFASKIADEYGVIPLPMQTIYTSCIESGTQDGYEVQQCLENKRNVPDELQVKLVVERVKQSDVTSCGYSLAGFPLNKLQANALFDAKLPLDKVIIFDVNEDTVTKRLKNRRMMTQTNEIKSVGFNLPMEELEQTIEMEGNDTEVDLLSDKLDAYLSNLDNVEDVFRNKGVDDEGNALFDVFHIDANGDTFDMVWNNVKQAVGPPPAEDEAAAKIQAMIRGKQERALQKEREEAAKKIQAISRGRAVRKETENRKELNKQVRFDNLISALIAAGTSEEVGESIGNLFPVDEEKDIPMKDFIGKIQRWKQDPLPELIENLQSQMEDKEETAKVLAEDFPRVDGKGKRVMNYNEYVQCVESHGGQMGKQRRQEIQERRRRASVMEFSKRKGEFEIMFQELDLDGDGQLSMEEFHNGFAEKARSWGYQGSMEAADSAEIEMFKAMDEDNSGFISYDEFKNYMDQITGELLQENKKIANEKYEIAREKDRLREKEEAMEYSMKANENYEITPTAEDENVYTRYNVPAVVVANAGTQKTYVNPKATTKSVTMGTSMGTSMDDDGPMSWNQFDNTANNNIIINDGNNNSDSLTNSVLYGTKENEQSMEIMNKLDNEDTLFRDDAALLAKIIKRYRAGLKYVFNFYSRTNAGNTAMRATRGVATFEAIAVEHSGVSRIMFRRFCADFNLLREDGAKARRVRRKVDDLCLTPEECMAIFDQHARKLSIVSSISRGKGVLFQNEFAACLAQLADTLMEPYSEAYPKTWRRVHAIFGRLDFGNILELRKRLRGKTGFGIGDGEPTGHGSTKEFAFKQGFSYELQPRDWPNAPLTPLPKKKSRVLGSNGFEDPLLVTERNTMQLQIAEEFEKDIIDFGDVDRIKEELYGVKRKEDKDMSGFSDDPNQLKIGASSSIKHVTGAENPEDVNSFLDDLGLTYGLEHKALMQNRHNGSNNRRRNNNNNRRRRLSNNAINNTNNSNDRMMAKGTIKRGGNNNNKGAKPVPPRRKSKKKNSQQRVSPKRRFITTQYDNL